MDDVHQVLHTSVRWVNDSLRIIDVDVDVDVKIFTELSFFYI